MEGQLKSGVQTLSGNTDNPPEKDISVDDCSTDEVGWMSAGGLITNHSSKRSNYMISITFEDSGNVKVGEGHAIVNEVEAGQKATWEAPSLTESPGAFTCRVTSVERFAS